MRQPTSQELRKLEEVLDWIRPVINLEWVYVERDNAILIGDNFIIRGHTKTTSSGVTRAKFNLVYGEHHPGETDFNFSSWEEEDLGSASNIYSLLPLLVGSLFHRLVEEKVYSKVKLAKLT